ncbi:hypothetical protein, partial [Salmonella sp. s51090]|uniref:hypothetical protein n=1 Tax=Salmonella sp. s51090 TaxID=3159651 RepID=UPI00397F1F21
ATHKMRIAVHSNGGLLLTFCNGILTRRTFGGAIRVCDWSICLGAGLIGLVYSKSIWLQMWVRGQVFRYASAMVTSTSTPGSMLIEVICLTISDGL